MHGLDEAISGIAAYNAVTAFCIIASAILLRREWKRTDSIEVKLDSTRAQLVKEQSYRQEVMEPLVRECKTALDNNTHMMGSCQQVIAANTEVMQQLLRERI